jgi:biotin carboxylase
MSILDEPTDLAPDTRPLLLMIATGDRSYREYLLRSNGPRYRVHLLLSVEPSWERQYITGWTVLTGMADTIDATEMIEAARAVQAGEPVHGVLSWDEARVLQTSKVAAALDLPGGDVRMILNCRDKHLTREALATAGVPQPRSILAGNLDGALAAADEIGYPVVLKPRALAASLGVVRVDSPAELRAQFSFANGTTLPGAWEYEEIVLVEEYLRGDEISVDAAVHDGTVQPMFVARKEVGYPPYFEEVGHVVDAGDPLVSDPEVIQILSDTHAALGFTDGMTHAELMLTPAGPKVIEVNARLGGDLIPYLGMRASGIDPGLAAAAVACGRPPTLVPDRKLVAAVRYFYVERENTTIASIEFDRTALPEAVDLVVTLAQPGEVMSPPPAGTLFGRIAFATTVAATERECREGLDAARGALRVGITNT